MRWLFETNLSLNRESTWVGQHNN